jgi:hypothetical protein
MMQTVRGKTTPGLRAHVAPLGTWDVRKDGEWEEVKGEFRHDKPVRRSTYDQECVSLFLSTSSFYMLTVLSVA